MEQQIAIPKNFPIVLEDDCSENGCELVSQQRRRLHFIFTDDFAQRRMPLFMSILANLMVYCVLFGFFFRHPCVFVLFTFFSKFIARNLSLVIELKAHSFIKWTFMCEETRHRDIEATRHICIYHICVECLSTNSLICI